MGVGELFTSITIINNNDDNNIMSPKLIAIDVTVPGSISLTRSCVVLKRQKILTGFLLLYTTVPCLSHIALTFGLHRSTPFSLPQILQ